MSIFQKKNVKNKELKSEARTIQYLLGKDDVTIEDVKNAIV